MWLLLPAAAGCLPPLEGGGVVWGGGISRVLCKTRPLLSVRFSLLTSAKLVEDQRGSRAERRSVDTGIITIQDASDQDQFIHSSSGDPRSPALNGRFQEVPFDVRGAFENQGRPS